MAKRPTAGELRHRVAFDKREEVNPDAPNDYGNTTDEFVEQFRCRASFEHGGGSEAVMASRLEGRNTFRVSIRSSEASRQIGSDWRMRDVRTGFEYAVLVVDAVTDPAWVFLDVQSGVAV